MVDKQLKLRHRAELAKVRAELEPWEKQLIEHKGKLEVICTESKLLSEKGEFWYFDRIYLINSKG